MTELIFNINTWFALAIVLVMLMFVVELAVGLCGYTLLGLFKDNQAMLRPLAVQLPWLRMLGINKLPRCLWLAEFLTWFALVGIALSRLLIWLAPQLDNTFFILPLAASSAVIMTSLCTDYLVNLLAAEPANPNLSARYRGCDARITVGVARIGHPAEACFEDMHGQTRYVLVEPATKRDIIVQGEKVVLVAPAPPVWVVRKHSSL